MWLKEIDGKLIPPPVNYRTPTGWIMNFYKSTEQMRKYGWRDWTDEEYAEWKEEHPDPEPPLRTMCTKYELVTCLQKYFPELLQSLMDTYAVTPNLQFYWNSVLDLDRNNPDFQNLASRLEITSAQLDAIFSKICE